MEHNFKWKNDGRTKVMIGCGTRPEIIRLAAVIKRCREYFDCCVVYYNQNWDRNLSTVFWEDFELKNTFGEYGPDILVPVVGENLGVTCGNILGRSYELLSELQPEGYLVLGDTNSCLSAISAKRLHIPLFHMEAGNRCKDECLPEELVVPLVGGVEPEGRACQIHRLVGRGVHAVGRHFVIGRRVGRISADRFGEKFPRPDRIVKNGILFDALGIEPDAAQRIGVTAEYGRGGTLPRGESRAEEYAECRCRCQTFHGSRF